MTDKELFEKYVQPAIDELARRTYERQLKLDEEAMARFEAEGNQFA